MIYVLQKAHYEMLKKQKMKTPKKGKHFDEAENLS